MYVANLVLIGILAATFHNYYLSIQIVTTERLVDVDQTGILRREVNEVFWTEVQNINYKQNGLLATIFDYGDVIIETAGAQTASKTSGFVFENVPQPKKISDKLSHVYNEKREEKYGTKKV